MSTAVQTLMIDYTNWNSLALRHFFQSDDGVPVDSLDVSDDSLTRIGGVNSLLLIAVRNYLRDSDDLMRRWNFQVQIRQEPDYFAFLLATCRIEWERESGQFAEHFQSSFGVNPQPWIELLPKLWEGLQKFLDQDPNEWRPLILSEHYGSFTNIGQTIGMVFPRRTDRRRLSKMFDDLPDRDPSLPQVCIGLEKVRTELSRECREQADWFRSHVVSSPNDIRVVRFWRVLRQALESSNYFQHEKAVKSDLTLSFWVDEDGILEPWCLLDDDSRVPPHHEILEGAAGIPGWSRVLVSKNTDAPSGIALFAENDDDLYQLLPDRTRLFLERGVIPLDKIESLDGIECFVPQIDSGGAAEAHMLHQKSELFQLVQTAGIRTERLGDTHWSSCFDAAEIEQQSEECRLRERKPRISVRGIRFRSNQYLNLLSFRPRFACDGASNFELSANGTVITLTANDWGEAEVDDLHGETAIIAKSADNTPLAKRQVLFLDALPPILTGQWSVFKQSYWIPAPSIPIGARSTETPHPSFLSGSVSDSPPDTTTWQTDEIWLGPHVGDVSSHKLPGYEWKLSEAADRRTRLVCYVGDICNPVLPSLDSVNKNKAACRLWRRSFDPGQTRCLNPDWLPVFEEYAQLRDPRAHKSKLGCEPDKFDGGPPPAREKIQFDEFATELHAGVHTLETVLRAETSGKQTPLSWHVVWETAAKSFDLDLESTPDRRALANALRAWQETGIFDVAGTAWGGLACLVRRPRFVLRRVEDQLVAVMVGLASEQLRQVVKDEAGSQGCECRLKFGRSQFIPPLLEIRQASEDRGFLEDLSTRLGLAPPEFLSWKDTTDLPSCIPDLRDVSSYFDKHEGDLPVCDHIWNATIGDNEAHVAKYKPSRQPPMWSVGPIDGRWALCTSGDWAWRLACLNASGCLPYAYSQGRFRRQDDSGVPGVAITSLFFPLEVGRLLSIIGNTLPGPTSTLGYEYYAPSEISGRILADRLCLKSS